MKKIWVIFGLALIVRLGYLLISLPSNQLVGDAVAYDLIAVNLLSGGGFSLIWGVPTPIRTPLYPFFLSGLYYLFGHNFMIVRIAQALLGSLMCVIVYLISFEIFRRNDNKVLIELPAWMCVFYPVFWAYDGLVLTETLFTLVFALAVYFVIKSAVSLGEIKIGVLIRYSAIVGLFLGLAVLTRPAVILLPCVFVVVDFFLLKDLKKIFIRWAAFGVVFLIVIIPWMVRNYKTFGEFKLASTGLGYGFYTTGRIVEGLSEAEALEDYLDLKEEYFKIHKDEVMPDGKILSPAFGFEKFSLKKGMEIIKARPFKYLLIVMKRLPRFWVTSHSSVFGVDRPLGEYFSGGKYGLIIFRLVLIVVHMLIVMTAVLGFIRGVFVIDDNRVVRKAVYYMGIIFVYFTAHILFDPCPRFHLPAMPYLFVLMSCFFLRRDDKNK